MTARETFWESGACGCGSGAPYDSCPCAGDPEAVYRELNPALLGIGGPSARREMPQGERDYLRDHPDFYGEPAPFLPQPKRWALLGARAFTVLAGAALLVLGLAIALSVGERFA